MATLHTITMVVYILICVVLTFVVLAQEGKNAGFSGSINGVADTYWGKNKGRSFEGKLVLMTRILAAAFIILSVVLNMSFWTK